MLEKIFLEMAASIGKMFINPLFYWSFILVIITGIVRIKRERMLFGIKVDDIFSEWRHTWWISFVFGCLLSLIMVGAGIIFTPSMILLISVLTILLSIHFRFTWLSPVYTIGISFLLLLILPPLFHQQSIVASSLFDHVNYAGLAILLGLLLFVQAILLYTIRKKDTFAELLKSKRGVWTGVHHLKKMAVIPFFIPIPKGWLPPLFDFWPYLPIGQATTDGTYGLMLLPMLIGFHFRVAGFESQQAKQWLGRRILGLAVVVLIAGVASVYIGWLSIAAIALGVLGWEFIHYRQRSRDVLKAPYFSQTDSGLRILTVIPGTTADKLGILPGEIISKANGKKVHSESSFLPGLAGERLLCQIIST
ncbi:PDZ domain-containing protein [Virgibacillus halophilus]|uniref:PDZ domain-containing protein n=1 Tax=Tigheibacillus halophilus TaxID=361280 RepID=A0ABU5C1P5_9BACI|nr:PDZ domain-containing protein [Virgibacillus halophilus]